MNPRPAAAIEIARDLWGPVGIQIVREAYRASAAAPIVLVLNGVVPLEIDHVLDDLVRDHPDFHGLVYCTIGEAGALFGRLGIPRIALVSSEPLRALLVARGTVVLPSHDFDVSRAPLAEGR